MYSNNNKLFITHIINFIILVLGIYILDVWDNVTVQHLPQ